MVASRKRQGRQSNRYLSRVLTLYRYERLATKATSPNRHILNASNSINPWIVGVVGVHLSALRSPRAEAAIYGIAASSGADIRGGELEKYRLMVSGGTFVNDRGCPGST